MVLVSAFAVWFLWLRDRGEVKKPVVAAKPVPVVAPKAADKPQRDADLQPQRFLIDDDPRGELRLEGQVIDENDAPVGGVTVVLGSNPPRTMTSEADGGFAFDALVGRPYTWSRAQGKSRAGDGAADLEVRHVG